MTFTFEPRPDEPPVDGVLTYLRREYSFHFEPAAPVDLARAAGTRGTTSLAIDTLQIEVGIETGAVLLVHGYHPYFGWRPEQLLPATPVLGSLRVRTDQQLLPGVGHRLAPEGSWVTGYDEGSGWIRVHPDPAEVDDQLVQVANGTLIGLRAGALNSVWLQPIFSDG